MIPAIIGIVNLELQIAKTLKRFNVFVCFGYAFQHTSVAIYLYVFNVPQGAAVDLTDFSRFFLLLAFEIKIFTENY